jgi:hypothetical protein
VRRLAIMMPAQIRKFWADSRREQALVIFVAM